MGSLRYYGRVSVPFRALVLSDLHAIHDLGRAREGASMNYALSSGPRGMLALTRDAVKEAFPDGVNIILCAGDMTDQADGGPLKEVWADLHWLANEFDSPLVATSGNHDYDSRASKDVLPYKGLQGLEPPFPFGEESDKDRYFSRQHAVFRADDVVVVSANSAAHHGYVKDGEPEHNFGHYDDALADQIEKSLSEVGELPSVRIFLTHHHLNQLPGFDTEERSFSVGHENVVRRLGEYGDWLIVHGHKHRGWIQYASGSGDSPPLFSSSSYSADFGEGSFADKVRHQFHVIEFGALSEDGLTGAHGMVTTWTHHPLGWKISGKNEELPGRSGFGWKANVSRLASTLREAVISRLIMTDRDIVELEPRFPYLTFDDLRRLVGQLESGTPKVLSVFSNDGLLQELSLAEEVPR